jgi:DNA replication protein DnaC
MKQLLKAQRITLTNGFRFKLPLLWQQAYTMLFAAYEAEVEARGRTEIRDLKTVADNLKPIAWELAKAEYSMILIGGMYGNGKTTTLRAIQSLINYGFKNGFKQYQSDEIVMIDFKNLLHIELAIDIATYATNTEDGKYDALVKCNCLGIDDMGREPQEVLHYGNKFYPIADLLERRYASQKLTIITTNLTIIEIKERYGERVYDRMREMCKIVNYRNSSFRGAPSQQQTNQN